MPVLPAYRESYLRRFHPYGQQDRPPLQPIISLAKLFVLTLSRTMDHPIHPAAALLVIEEWERFGNKVENKLEYLVINLALEVLKKSRDRDVAANQTATNQAVVNNDWN